jgi:hypothetical protein
MVAAILSIAIALAIDHLHGFHDPGNYVHIRHDGKSVTPHGARLTRPPGPAEHQCVPNHAHRRCHHLLC